MKWKEKDDLSWCCVSRRRSDDDDDERKDPNNQTTEVPGTSRSTNEVALPVEKVKKPTEERERKDKNIFASFPVSSSSFSSCFSSFAHFFDYDDSSSSSSSIAYLPHTSFFYYKGLRIRENFLSIQQCYFLFFHFRFISI